jgi:hypothetical protein
MHIMLHCGILCAEALAGCEAARSALDGLGVVSGSAACGLPPRGSGFSIQNDA